MRVLTILRQRLRSLFSRRTVDDELDEEMRYHVQRDIDEQVARGVNPDDARYAALREFRDFEQRKEECRDTRGWNVMDNLRQDFRYAIRQLHKNPGFTAVAVLVLAFGLCAGVAIFAFVDASLIKPMPYRDASRLVGVYESVPQCPRCNLSYFDYLDWKRLSKAFESLEVYQGAGFILTTPSGIEPAISARVSSGFFRALGVAPILGRDFHAGEDLPGAPRTVLLSNSTWRKRYGAKPEVVGTTAILDGEAYVIIGVLPRDFHFAPAGPAEFWAPTNPTGFCEKRRGCHNLYGIARLKDGISAQAALADAKVIAGQLEKEYPVTNRGQGAAVVPLVEVIVGDIRPILLTLLGGAGLLLLIACVNVANLLLVRSESRRREISVRGALGASRWRLISQFVAEAVVLVAIGNTLGLAATFWAIKLLTSLVPADLIAGLPFLTGLGLNWRVLAFAAAVSMMQAALFAISPALRLSFDRMQSGLGESGRWSTGGAWRRLGSKLVALELATAMVLLVAAGLLGQSLQRLLHVRIGFQSDHLATLMIGAPPTHYGTNAKLVRLQRGIVTAVSQLPGAKSAALASVLPVGVNGNTEWFRIVGRPYHGEHWEINQRNISADYFTTIGAKLIRGRYFTDDEDSSKPGVMIINQALAKMYFAGEDPIGQEVGDIELSPRSLRKIIGIVEDMRDGPLDEEVRPAEFLPLNQHPETQLALVVRTSQTPDAFIPALTRSIHEMDSGLVTMMGMSMDQRIANSPSAYARRSSAALVGAFAAVALLLGVVGLYGVIAYSVSQRTREIGVRMALGAAPKAVYRMIFREAGVLTAIGIAGGVACSLAVTTLLRGLLYGIESWDVRTLGAVAVVLACAALAASFVPARRAAQVNPVDALRME
jgi:predicted permease